MQQKHQLAAKRFQELGHVTRLHIYRLLIKAGPDGLNVGSLQKKLNIPASTLSHHINKLVQVDLVEQVRVGNTLLCRPKIKILRTIVDYLQSECCSDKKTAC